MIYVSDHNTLKVDDKVFIYNRLNSDNARSDNARDEYMCIAEMQDATTFTEKISYSVMSDNSNKGLIFRRRMEECDCCVLLNDYIYLLTDLEYELYMIGETV